MSVILPSSIYSSNDCCCFLLKYCISSKYSSIPPEPMTVSVCDMTSLTSDSDAVVALSLYIVISACAAMMFAAVVLPVPGGP